LGALLDSQEQIKISVATQNNWYGRLCPKTEELRTMKVRTSKQMVQEYITLLREKGYDLRPQWDTRRPFIVVQFQAFGAHQPKVHRFGSLTEALLTLERMWQETE